MVGTIPWRGKSQHPREEFLNTNHPTTAARSMESEADEEEKQESSTPEKV
jgi:hypothetical protein